MLGKNIPSSLLAIADDGLGKKQEPRTDLEIGALRRFQIDIEANLVFLKAETDHAALLNKIVGFADGEDRSAVQGCKNCGRTSFVPAHNEKEMASSGVLLLLKMADLKRARADLLALNGGFKNAGQGAFTCGAKDQGAVLGTKSVRRPIHELREMENEGGFQLILGRIGLRERTIRGEQLKEQKN
jgi:predicted  nucleic acid-binding Zn-ribbon protein